MNTSDLISQKKDYYNRQMPALPPKEAPAPYQANPSEAAREVIANTPTEAPRVSLADMAEKPDPTAPGKTFLQQQQEMYDKITAAQNGVETPEQEAARKKRDALRIGLTTFADGLAALSNLYFTTKGAPNQNIERQLPKLQQDLYRERLERDAKLQRFREWQRQKAEQGERYKRNRDLFNLKQAAAEKENEAKRRWEADKMKLKAYLDAGLIDRKTAADLEKQGNQAKLNAELENIRQKNRMALKQTPSYSDRQIATSATASDESILTRSKPLSKEEAMQLARYSDDVLANIDSYRKKTTTTNDDGTVTRAGEIDWYDAAAAAMNGGYIPAYVLEQMGFKKSQSSRKTTRGVNTGTGEKHLNL